MVFFCVRVCAGYLQTFWHPEIEGEEKRRQDVSRHFHDSAMMVVLVAMRWKFVS